jgi:Family of unknown function (DUF5706)
MPIPFELYLLSLNIETMSKNRKKNKTPKVKYYLMALNYLQEYYQNLADENFYFGFPLIKNLVEEGKIMAKSEGLEGYDYENVLIIICFRFAGITNFFVDDESNYKLLHDFAAQVEYPDEEIKKIELSITNNRNYTYPSSAVENVAWDAISSRFTVDDMIVHVTFLKEEFNRINKTQYTELQILTELRKNFIRSDFSTKYGKEHYLEKRDRNFSRLDKRIQKLEEIELESPFGNGKEINKFSDKETEDLFKIAFRNYVHLVSVADSKAGLLLNVNSIIVSVAIAFVVRHTFNLLPSIILLSFSFCTILLSILASRPQVNQFMQDKNSSSYQTFFFGSVDLIGNEFSKAIWENYSLELDALLKGGKEKIFEEMYKESFNVRKVLGRKFMYLNIAYYVFIGGLFISIITFIIDMY